VPPRQTCARMDASVIVGCINCVIVSKAAFPNKGVGEKKKRHTSPLHHNSRYSSGLSTPPSLAIFSKSSLLGAGSMRSATYPSIFLTRNMRLALRRLLLRVALAWFAVSKGRGKGRYPSEEMEGRALP
jgi:hypothetical protein